MTSHSDRQRQAHWDGRYRDIGSDQVSWFEERPTLSLDMLAVAGVPPAMSVIDVGGGASKLCATLVQIGYRDVTVLDISAEALRTSKATLLSNAEADLSEVRWLHADLLQWEPSRQWDVWHDRAVFHFLTEQEDRESYRHRLREALAPNGLALIATFAADGPSTCSSLRVCRYDTSELLNELGDGFDEIASGRFVHTTPSGAAQPFAWIVAQRS